MADKTYVSDYDGTMVRTTNGRFETVYKGGALPSDADPDHVQVLLDRKLVHAGEPTGGIVADVPAAPPFPAPAAPARTSSYDGTSAPAKSASKADWLDWAQKVEGVAPDSDEGKALGEKTRDELAETYADKTPAA